MYKNKKIGLVIPCYKVSKTINNIVNNAPNFVDKIYLVDDKCPENSVKKVKSKSKKIKKIFRKINGGVGAAVKDGYNLSLKDKNYLTVRIDGDGQMDLNIIKKFIDPIINNEAEFTKGNRFTNFSFIKKMPALRILGNIFFSLFGNLIIKNLSIFDFLNGYTSLSNRAIYKVMKTNLDNDFFFDSILIYQSVKLKIKILDIDMEAKYENEKSNIKIFETGSLFLFKNILFILGFKK
jgi:dolichol-phosphate mannosyltransferase